MTGSEPDIDAPNLFQYQSNQNLTLIIPFILELNYRLGLISVI
jgi:hypothetical protein